MTLYQCEECATLTTNRDRDGYAYCDKHAKQLVSA